MLCVETYQFYYLLTIFGRGSIIFDDLKGGWVFEFSTLCRRVKEQYIYFICILKYWHFLFVFISSVFIINRNFERRQHYFISVSFIFQNFLILFILNLALGIQWIKWLLLRWIDSLYFWFFCNTGDSFLTLVQRELVVLVQAIYML
jgi:hypothetical protein